MTNILLAASQQTFDYQIIIWIVGILIVLALVAAIFWQLKMGRQLREELAQLDGEKKKDVEFDFVLKAMGLSVWHINTVTGEVFFDKDYRAQQEGGNGIDGITTGRRATPSSPIATSRAVPRVSSVPPSVSTNASAWRRR